MKCPKCHYLSFDPEPRCRNCGFSLNLEATDLPIAVESAPSSPLADLELRTAGAHDTDAVAFDVTKPADAAAAPPFLVPAPATTSAPRPVRRIASAPRARPRQADVDASTAAVAPFSAAAPSSPHPTTELPLFVKGFSDIVEPAPRVSPVVTVAADSPSKVEHHVPFGIEDDPTIVASPLAGAAAAGPVASERPAVDSEPPPVVTSSGPVSDASGTGHAAMWSSTRRKLGPLDRDLLNDLERIEKQEQHAKQAAADPRPADRAGVSRRLAAAVVDGLILSGMLSALVAVTLRWTLLGWADLAMLSTWPTGVFLALVAFGYLSLFTAAAGQTPGKMLVGIRVVGVDRDGGVSAPLSPARACLRELIALPSMLALGLGFWPALVGTERGLHDRLAATRVVRA